VVTPEIYDERTIGTDPLPPDQVWTLSSGTQDEYSGLFRIEVNE